jgi:hypothetical protein
MSPRGSDSSPSPDIYVGLLFVSLASLITGIIFLVLEIGKYGGKLAP